MGSYRWKGGRLKGALTHEEVIDLYVNQRWSCEMIAKKDGTSRVSILMLLRREGVELRSPGSGNHLRKWSKHGLTVGHAALGVSPIVLARFRVITLLGGRCVDCGEDDLRVLELNHIKDKQHRLKMRDLAAVATGKRHLLEVMCANCNVRYEYEQKRRFLPPLEALAIPLRNRR